MRKQTLLLWHGPNTTGRDFGLETASSALAADMFVGDFRRFDFPKVDGEFGS
jgi:hypothetical protein